MRLLIALLAMAFSASNAVAQWSSQVTGPDVFGNTRVVASSGGLRESLIVQCDSKDVLLLAYAFRAKEFERARALPATLLIQSDAAPVKLQAELRTWNDNYWAVVASGRTMELMGVVTSLASARGKINVGAEVNGNQLSETFGSQGSRNAIAAVVRGCKLDSGTSKQ